MREGDSPYQETVSGMNPDRVFVVASGLIALIYLVSVIQAGYLTAFALSFVAFGAIAIFAHMKKDPFLVIVGGEILVIINPAILSSLVIQGILAYLFFFLYGTKEPRLLAGIGITYIGILSVFAWAAVTMQAYGYMLFCIAALILGYLVIRMHWRKIIRKTTEDV